VSFSQRGNHLLLQVFLTNHFRYLNSKNFEIAAQNALEIKI